jgi:catechol 2,3-dioxygenase-like lactoylglutathione lyase family enzyme
MAARGLDHVVHVVRDLDSAAAVYERLGFQVGARNVHPWGTHNRLVQFAGFFLEILTVGEPEKIVPPAKGVFSFGAFNRDFLAAAGEGLACMVVEGHDPAAEKAELDARGFGGFDLLNFSRKGKRADGSDTGVGFSIAFARDPASRHAGFFTCKQTHPQNFWAAELQRHDNGARAIAACALVAENPTDHHIFLETLIGVRDIRATSLGLTVPTPRGDVLALDPRSFRDAYGVEAPEDEGLRIAALVFAVTDLAATKAFMERSGVKHHLQRGQVVVGPEIAHGSTIIFAAS